MVRENKDQRLEVYCVWASNDTVACSIFRFPSHCCCVRYAYQTPYINLDFHLFLFHVCLLKTKKQAGQGESHNWMNKTQQAGTTDPAVLSPYWLGESERLGDQHKTLTSIYCGWWTDKGRKREENENGNAVYAWNSEARREKLTRTEMWEYRQTTLQHVHRQTDVNRCQMLKHTHLAFCKHMHNVDIYTRRHMLACVCV